MHFLFPWDENRTLKLITLGLVLALAIVFVAARSTPAPGPMQYQVLVVPGRTLTPQGGLPANAEYTVSSSNGPFCIQGFRIDPSTTMAVGPGQIGDMLIQLEYIDNGGLSHPYIKLIDGNSGGSTPYDLVISYGSPICAAQRVTFHATVWPGMNDIGASATLSGQAIVLTLPDNTITVQ